MCVFLPTRSEYIQLYWDKRGTVFSTIHYYTSRHTHTTMLQEQEGIYSAVLSTWKNWLGGKLSKMDACTLVAPWGLIRPPTLHSYHKVSNRNKNQQAAAISYGNQLILKLIDLYVSRDYPLEAKHCKNTQRFCLCVLTKLEWSLRVVITILLLLFQHRTKIQPLNSLVSKNPAC